MSDLKRMNEIEDLYNKNRLLINLLIGYCNQEQEGKEVLSNIKNTLEIVSEYHDKIKATIDNYCTSLI